MPKALTVKQQYWFDHIAAAQHNSQSLSNYAAQHELSLKALYNWRWTFSKKPHKTSDKKTAFVKIIPPAISVNEDPAVVVLPNGIRLQFAALTPSILTMLLQC